MTVAILENHSDGSQLDDAVSALLSEEIPVGPPASIAAELYRKWAQADVRPRQYHVILKLKRLAVVVAVIVGLAISWNLFDHRSNIALADIAHEFHKVQSIQFRRVYYIHRYGGPDKTSVWRGSSYTDCNFKTPGFSREVSFDEDGIPWRIVTMDKTRGITLELRLTTKRAILTENPPPSKSELQRGLTTSLAMLESWLAHGKVSQQLGTRDIQGRVTIGLRISYGDRRADFWIDRQTRQIVRVLEPTAAEYDPEHDRALRTSRPENVESDGTELKGTEWTDIIYEPPIDGVQFVLQPPEGYKVERTKSRLPTEKDLIEWLGVFAEVRGGAFNDDENAPFSKSEEFQARLKSPPAKPSKWDEIFERGYIQKEDVSLYGSGSSVVVLFRSRVAAEGTWHYQGKGVKLGDAQSPICWYRLPDATTYRVIYGNLDVKNVEEKNLPAKR